MDETFEARLKAAMEKEGIKTYRELAERVGVDPNTVTNWISRGGISRGSSRLALANALNVDAEWLRTGTGSMELTVREITGHRTWRNSLPQRDEEGAQEEPTLHSSLMPQNVSPRVDVETSKSLMERMRWIMGQPDRSWLFNLGPEEIDKLMEARGSSVSDEFHRKLLSTRIHGVMSDKGISLPKAKIDAVFRAAWEEGGGWGTNPEDIQISRYIQVAEA